MFGISIFKAELNNEWVDVELISILRVDLLLKVMINFQK